jgi:Predicted hydrolases or acyltransferases (alpha/beta hydrolase superfamily)
LIGHSLGTPICRQVVFSYPNLASKMVDVYGVYCFYPDDSLTRAENEKQYEMLVSFFDGTDIKATLQQFTEPLFIDKTPDDVKDYAMNTMIQTPQYGAYSTMKNLITPNYWTGKTIEIPTLVFASKNSQIPSNYNEMMGALYPNMEYQELDSIGHFIMMEDPKMFNKMLKDFINH